MKKKIGRINLREVKKVMSYEELRGVLGGNDGSYYGDYFGNSGTCGVNITCSNGVRVGTIRGISKSEAKSRAANFNQDNDSLYIYSQGCSSGGTVWAYWCCDSC
jgi:hypothetical protein